MTADSLVDELAGVLGSIREARWLLDELGAASSPEQRRDEALALAARRVAGEPLQYVLGHWPFRTLDLLVDPRVLIPRPETELLVDAALRVLAGTTETSTVCDLGCGTGAIALSIALEARARGRVVDVVATDVSEAALEVARANAARTGATSVAFLQGSWFDALPATLEGRIDACCANPPYVAAEERDSLARELDFEPEIALVAGDGSDSTPGFAAVESVIVGAARWLAPGGTLLVEHADHHRAAAVACCARAGLDVVVDHDDLAGRPRFLEARRPR